MIQIGIPRTASGSMREALRDKGLMLIDYPRDILSKVVRDMVGEGAWESSFKFSFVRNPIDRFISAYTTLPTIADEAKKNGNLEEVMAFNPSIFIPQIERLTEEMDFIGRFENIEADWKKLTKKLGLSVELEHANLAESVRPKKPLTSKEEIFVREYYAKDFKRFGYN